jgi:hypothetical protein
LKIIYNCFGGSHSSVTAAAIHLGLLPDTRIAKPEEFLTIPYYDAQIGKDHGKLRLMGIDSSGNEVYIVGKKNLGNFYEKIMRHLISLSGEKQEKYLFINTMPYVNIWMVIGGYTSRRLGMILPGRSIVIYGCRKAYFKFVHLVNLLKERYLLLMRKS